MALDETITKLGESIIALVDNKVSKSGADVELSNLTSTGKSQYNPFCINTGVTDENGNPACIVLNPDVYSTMTSTITLPELEEFQAVNNGYLVVNLDKVNGSAYTISHLDFTGVTSFEEAAEIIQSGIRENEDGGELYTSAAVEYIAPEEEAEDETEEDTEAEEAAKSGVFVLTAGLPGAYIIDYAGEDTAPLLGWNEEGNPDITTGDITNITTSGEFVCSAADGTIYTVSDTLRCDIYGLDDGDYNIFINPVDNTLEVTSGTIYTDVKLPDEAVEGDYLLNISKVPYSLDQLTDSGIVRGLNAVWAGVLTKTGGASDS